MTENNSTVLPVVLTLCHKCGDGGTKFQVLLFVTQSSFKFQMMLI